MKIRTIDSISDIDELASLIIDILEQLGVHEIKRIANNVITAVEKSPLEERKMYFFLTLSELNGKVNTIRDLIGQYQVEHAYIVSTNKKISNYFLKWLKGETKIENIKSWAREDIIKLIDDNIPDFWSHKDIFLKKYEESFISTVKNDFELKKLLRLDDKFDKLLNIFIEPKVFLFKDDPETQRKIKYKINLNFFLKNNNYVISGEAGTGKSTLLKEIGKRIIERNKEKRILIKSIPIYIKSSDIFNSEFDISNTITKILQKKYSSQDIEKVFANYEVILLLDSIDEFEKENRKTILETISKFSVEKNLRFILCTRNYDGLIEGCNMCEHLNPTISNFDLRQVKAYLDHFFKFDLAKSDKLWEILLDNNTLEKIPVNPLTISLISILYEEKGYEIPATITDVYDNFNLFLLGRLNVNSRLDFLNINIKERILSLYALEVIQTENKKKKNESEFLDFVCSFFKKKSITIEKKIYPEILKSLTVDTGILFIDDNGFVSFKHDNFLEYYASIEIFNHHRGTHEDKLIENFTKFNWQNTAIFYTGRTKDMPEFLEKLLLRVKKYTLLRDCLIGASGLGYLLQSLWLTDSQIRKNGVLEALNLIVKADGEVKKLSASGFHYFKKVRDFDVALINLVWFFKHFNSIALRDPLLLAFDELHSKLPDKDQTVFHQDRFTSLYKLFCLAATLNSGRTTNPEKLELLFEEDGILTIPLFVLLFDSGLNIIESENKTKLKKDFKIKNRIKKYTKGVKFYLENTSEDIRFTSLEMISSFKRIELFTEGKTDSSIIQHAFSVLTKNKDPEWKVTSCEKSLKSKSGGSHQLSKLLTEFGKKIKSEFDIEKTIIGIFDNDSSGTQEFNGLKSEDFEYISKRIRKHKTKNIYAIILPIPPLESYKNYIQEKQEFRLFEIEHYFPLEMLKDFDMVKESPIASVYEIKDKKNDFSEKVINIKKPEIFKNFIYLFREIDGIVGSSINYIE